MNTIIKDTLNVGDLAYIVAPPKSRASSLALELGLALAAGWGWFGTHMMDAPVPVRWFDFERNTEYLPERVQTMADAMGVLPDVLNRRFGYTGNQLRI